MAAQRSQAALADFEAAQNLPDNLPSERGSGARTNAINYWLGTAHAALGDMEKAREHWERATATETSGPSRRRRGTRVGPRHYYRGLALLALGRKEEAQTQFHALIEAGRGNLKEATNAKTPTSVEDRHALRTRRADAHYLIGLGQLGLGQKDKADQALHNALEARPDHLLAQMARDNAL
jgi:tetratricopeptide (TPR) repeat protein